VSGMAKTERGRTFLLDFEPDEDPGKLSSHAGGRPALAHGQEWPVCQVCNLRMVFYFQLSLSAKFGLPFVPDSMLLVFACSRHAEVRNFPRGMLPKEFWGIQHQKSKCAAYLNRPGEKILGPREPALLTQLLRAKEHLEKVTHYTGSDGTENVYGENAFKVSGVPGWLQDPLLYRCCCGAPMSFICQTDGDIGFQRSADAPRQELELLGGLSCNDERYGICGIESCYFFGCSKHCDSRAVLVVSQA